MAISVTVNPTAPQRAAEAVEPGVQRDIVRRAVRVERLAKRLAPVDTGRLRSSISHELIPGIGGARGARVGTNVQYAIYQHEGTGIYGPSGQPIRPRSASRLVFTPKGSSTRVYAKQVRGTPPNPFLRDALRAVRD